MKLDFCVSHNYTSSSSAALLLHRRHRAAATLLLLPLYMYIHCFFRIEKNHPGIVFFLLETMQVGIKFTISFN